MNYKVMFTSSDLPPDERANAADIIDNLNAVGASISTYRVVAAGRYVSRTHRLPSLRW